MLKRQLLFLLSIANSQIRDFLPLLPTEESFPREAEIREHAISLRDSGFGGSLGVTEADTPSEFTNEVMALYEKITGIIEDIDALPFASLTECSNEILDLRREEVDTSSSIMRLFQGFIDKGCSKRSVCDINKSPDALPDCIFNYYNSLKSSSEAQREKLGIAVRDLVETQDPGFFSVCEIASEMLNFPELCSKLKTLMTSANVQIQMANSAVDDEINRLGEDYAFLEISNNCPLIEKLTYGYFMASVWHQLGVQSQILVGEDLYSHWKNEPVHKWRYLAGLLEAISAWVAALMALEHEICC